MVTPGSDRLQILEPFQSMIGPELSEMPVLIKTRGKTTTDHISPAGSALNLIRLQQGGDRTEQAVPSEAATAADRHPIDRAEGEATDAAPTGPRTLTTQAATTQTMDETTVPRQQPGAEPDKRKAGAAKGKTDQDKAAAQSKLNR